MSQKQVKKRRVSLDDLSLGMDGQTGKIVVGVADKEGTILEENAKDITEDFFRLMNFIIQSKIIADHRKKKATADAAAKEITGAGDAPPPQAPGVTVEPGVDAPASDGPRIVLPTAGEVAAAGKMRRANVLPFERGKR